MAKNGRDSLIWNYTYVTFPVVTGVYLLLATIVGNTARRRGLCLVNRTISRFHLSKELTDKPNKIQTTSSRLAIVGWPQRSTMDRGFGPLLTNFDTHIAYTTLFME